jgi:mannose-6-phosphate isomerase-like protein (cupin superfamily)
MAKINFQETASVETPSSSYVSMYNKDSKIRVKDSSGNDFEFALVLTGSQAINNNQSSAIDITGALVDSTDSAAMNISYLITRTADAASVISSGSLSVALKDGVFVIGENVVIFDDVGVEFSVDNSGTIGQLQYTSTNITATTYSGNIKYTISYIGA